MPRAAARDLYARRLRAANNSARYVDLAVEFVDERDLSPLLVLGGVWDTRLREWCDDREHRSALQIRVHPGQLDTVLWFRDWITAYMGGDPLPEPVYSALLLGGSRSGKTWIGLRMFVAFVVAVPGARAWAVQEVEIERADELQTELDELLPEAWFAKSGNKYRCLNGSTITIRSAKYPRKLKRGRCDIAFLNEGQNVPELAHSMLRMRTSDTSGIVITAANPPNDNPEGQWVADFAVECEAGRRRNAVHFHYDPENNPHINKAQLEALKRETDPRTYEIEVLGRILPPSNAVMHAFSPLENVDELPQLTPDVTALFAQKRALGPGATDIVGADFQRTPHMAAVVGRLFRNPADAARPLIYWFQEVIVELGDEHDLSNGLYDLGLDPEHTVIIGDASGAWQDADRTKGGTSFDTLRACGWRRIHRPDKKLKSNPPVQERTKNDNRLFHSEDGSRIVHVDPRCVSLIAACKEWRRKHGVPMKHSEHAHIAEAMSYANWRLMPLTIRKTRVGYKRLKGRTRPTQLRRW